ncbi:MAG: RNA polymerase sigma factor [Dysgonamonadaceae bacterium]|jgi:RNA polymerase sigma-70 factor (ECF subfamily)|nr:RNA polymerase sigma factor [Dysgonamonadaceae bacterium]
MDSDHFKRIFLPFHKKLYRMAYRFLENQADAEDMVQETYIKLWQKRLELESLLNPESFAVTLLKNSCLDFLRKVRPEWLPVYEIALAAPESLAEQIENREQLEHIQQIVDQLPEQQKQVVELKIWDNLSDEEIEQRTGLKKGNIKVIVSRAKKTIKERYLQCEKDENR